MVFLPLFGLRDASHVPVKDPTPYSSAVPQQGHMPPPLLQVPACIADMNTDFYMSVLHACTQTLPHKCTCMPSAVEVF
eukprot:6466376-Amphidinium_carterae.1